MPDSTVRKVPEHEDWFEVADDGLFEVRVPAGYLQLEDHLIPSVLQFRTTQQEPQIYFEAQATTSGVRLTEFTFIARDPDSQGIRQTDFREVQVSAIVEDLVTLLTFRIERDSHGLPDALTVSVDDVTNIRKFVSGVGRRDITPQFLQRVAHIYRENIDGAPTKAVEHHFQVSQRTAAGYVSKARQRGLLPPTKRGKKNA